VADFVTLSNLHLATAKFQVLFPRRFHLEIHFSRCLEWIAAVSHGFKVLWLLKLAGIFEFFTCFCHQSSSDIVPCTKDYPGRLPFALLNTGKMEVCLQDAYFAPKVLPQNAKTLGANRFISQICGSASKSLDMRAKSPHHLLATKAQSPQIPTSPAGNQIKVVPT
jgi:hypothetical protein